MISIIFLVKNDWKGPTSKIWGDDQCNSLGNLATSYGVDGCKQACEQKLGCTAINYNHINGGCTLKECVVPVPVPLSYYPKHKGYYITGIKTYIIYKSETVARLFVAFI